MDFAETSLHTKAGRYFPPSLGSKPPNLTELGAERDQRDLSYGLQPNLPNFKTCHMPMGGRYQNNHIRDGSSQVLGLGLSDE